MKLQMPLTRFKAAVARGQQIPGGTALHKAATAVIEPAGDRRKLFTISTPTVDRDNDTVSLDGWVLDGYLRNPVVLWGHDQYSPPVGRTVEIGTDGGALKAVVEFVPADMPLIGAQAEMLHRMTDLGFLHACSVGFRPLEYVVSKDRMTDEMWFPPLDFVRQELLEWSICTIPANAEATIETDVAADPTQAARDGETAATARSYAVERQNEIATRRRQLRAACY